MASIYLDYNASTPIDPAASAAMRPFLADAFGNPSSGHWASAPAKAALEKARGQVAGLLGCAAGKVVFTSGGSEVNNFALKGVLFALRRKDEHIIITAVEHPAILGPCRFLERLGAADTYLPVDRTGGIDPDAVRRAITPRIVLISIMHANNEVGTVQPITEIGRIARDHGVLFHSDAAQLADKTPTNVDEPGVDLLTIVGHKLYAPKDVGALYIRRAGTESALLAVGLGVACALVQDLAPTARVKTLRDRLWSDLQRYFGDRVVLNGHPDRRLPNALNVSFVGRVGAEILAGLHGVAASTGSACQAARIELSPVLRAMGVPPEIGMGAIRFSLGRYTTADEVDAVGDRLSHMLANAA